MAIWGDASSCLDRKSKRRWRLDRITGHVGPMAAIPPAVEPRGTGWIRIPARSGRRGHPSSLCGPGRDHVIEPAAEPSDQHDYRSASLPSHTAPVISRDLARRLAPHVSWRPANGDMFFIPRPEIVDSIFTVSDMVVELVVANGESRFHFNGTVEWALDSVESDGVVWLPRENQLREMLGDYFLSLDSSAAGFVVTVSGPGKAYHTEPELDAANAYARAALYVLGVEKPSALSSSTG